MYCNFQIPLKGTRQSLQLRQNLKDIAKASMLMVTLTHATSSPDNPTLTKGRTKQLKVRIFFHLSLQLTEKKPLTYAANHKHKMAYNFSLYGLSFRISCRTYTFWIVILNVRLLFSLSYNS